MERLDGGSVVPERLRGGIIALGNFDGFHLGHQAVVGRAIARARAEGRPALVGTFDPHPIRYFVPDSAPFRLSTLDQRQRWFADAGADAMVVFRFDAALAALGAEAFVAERLVDALGVGGVVTEVNGSNVFEGVTQSFIGVTEKQPFTVTPLSDPPRGVVDVAR